MRQCKIPSLIHFFGPDGSGKSTHVQILVDTLKKCEPRIKKIWLRSPHTLAFLLWRFLVKIGFYRTVVNPFGDAVKIPAVNCRKSLRHIWIFTEFLGVLPIIMRIHLSMLRGYKCIAERYVLDTVTTIAYFVSDMNFLRSRTSKLLYRLIPADTVFIFLDSDFRTILKRRARFHHVNNYQQRKAYGTLPRSAVEPQEFIDFQRTAYKILANSFKALAINTSDHSIEETSKLILDYLSSY